MATSTLRAIIIVVAVVFGGVVLANAFPGTPTGVTNGGGAPPPESPTPTTPTSPGESPQTSPPAPQAQLQGAVLEILNGTSTTGLAAAWAQKLKQEGAMVPDENLGNHEALDVTTLVFTQGSRPLAELLRDRFFAGAELRQAEAGDVKEGAEVQIILGADHADLPE